MHPILQITPRISILPVIHASAESALMVRRIMLSETFDCLAVPLPPSFRSSVEQGIHQLPTPSIAIQKGASQYKTSWTPEDDQHDESLASVTFVPIDPCQAVIAGLRIAIGERIERAYIDPESDTFVPFVSSLPDDYALQKLPPEKFAAAILPFLTTPPEGPVLDRIRHQGEQLRRLGRTHGSVLMICSILEWPWVRAACLEEGNASDVSVDVESPVLCGVVERNLLFLLGELPFVTALHERARASLDDDEHLSIDGVKELLLAARDAYLADFKNRARPITPQTLGLMLKYIRNLTLLERRFTPDLYTIVIGAKQIAGDSFALHVAEMARTFRPNESPLIDSPYSQQVAMGIDRMRLPDGSMAEGTNRLPGNPIVWRSCDLQRRPEDREQSKWQMEWNPLGQCSWPPEDEVVENFRAHVTQKALDIMGTDLIRTEKFTTSVKDGIDIRDTLRNWHSGEIYVKVLPTRKGTLDSVVMLFDAPADPRHYPWRATWFAEHQNESTLAFFATDFMSEMVGPGIGLATYGGAMFLFPPVNIPDIWNDPRLDFADTLEERMVAAACMYARSSHVAMLSHLAPGPGFRRLAKKFKKKLVHVPLAHFSTATVQQLRMVHVLNGRHIRSYASHFIRRA